MTRSADLLDSDLVAGLAEAIGEASPSPHEDLERRQLVTTLLRTLSPRLERLIRLYYGIGVPQAGAGEIAESFGITRARIDMLRKEALRRMRIAARHIDAAEPELIADPAYPLPRGWTMPDIVNQNARFVMRLNEARGVPVVPGQERPVVNKRKPRVRKPPAPVRTWTPSPTRQTHDHAIVHRSALVDGLIGAGKVFVLPAGAGAIIASAEYGGIVGLLAGVIALPVMAFAYERWADGR
ncbi:MAG: sigma-70 family RNA polymerase sigma factor [Sphingobium sp.]|uniref:sigma-70 family RNA polymerase sigma factor n=1 Tax=Sphingobium sp. TaxID=1912891 RepID=UPI0029B4785D|nr:sigma-70 family RNA polymerase sigma factor [Sphingobium sp.]MDX3911608.1 sigma-70 family RNA polymerase sigma factor [Sphingobium sp.]